MKIKTVEALQIAAALAAALRWAIALMPLDGMQFALSSRAWFEPVSFFLSLGFAAVEVMATAYIMRAWRKEADKHTRSLLMSLWVFALVLMTFAQVPPLIANIDGVSVATFPLVLKGAWVTAGVAMTFVVIGGVGYAEKSLETQPTTQQAGTTDTQTGTQLILVPNQAPAYDAPSRPLNDLDILTFWRAHGQADAWQQVSEKAHQCLNGASSHLEQWYSDKRSINGLCNALGVKDDQQVKRIGSLVRGLIKPVVTP